MATIWRRVRKNRMGMFGGGVVVFFALVAVFAPLVATHSPVSQSLTNTLESPSSKHWFGTDELGRDVFSRVVYGARLSMTIGLIVVFLGGIVGVFVGVVSGYVGGAVDLVLMRVIDVIMAFPSILLALIVVGILGPGLYNVMIAVGVSVIPRFARIARAAVVVVRQVDFVTAAQSTGASSTRIVTRHVLPNAVAPIIVQATLLIANAIITASSLSFLGLGPKPPSPEWGVMLSEARNLLYLAPHTLIFPGIAISVVVIGFNILGDALRDALDVRMRSLG